MKLWLDDVRPAPKGWTQVRSVNEAIAILETGEVVEASLDHDLGDYSHDGGDGWRLVDWMAETGTWPAQSVAVHSANPIGVDRMLSTVDQYGPYDPGSKMSKVRRRA